jgi:hypothetical protein
MGVFDVFQICGMGASPIYLCPSSRMGVDLRSAIALLTLVTAPHYPDFQFYHTSFRSPTWSSRSAYSSRPNPLSILSTDKTKKASPLSSPGRKSNCLSLLDLLYTHRRIPSIPHRRKLSIYFHLFSLVGDPTLGTSRFARADSITMQIRYYDAAFCSPNTVITERAGTSTMRCPALSVRPRLLLI